MHFWKLLQTHLSTTKSAVRFASPGLNQFYNVTGFGRIYVIYVLWGRRFEREVHPAFLEHCHHCGRHVYSETGQGLKDYVLHVNQSISYVVYGEGESIERF